MPGRPLFSARRRKMAARSGTTNLQRFVDEQLPRLKRHRDYREMLAQQKDIDAVIIATPDHMHAPIASAAIGRRASTCYVQKPMCWSVQEGASPRGDGREEIRSW
jgi:predicted dehydrogenase